MHILYTYTNNTSRYISTRLKFEVWISVQGGVSELVGLCVGGVVLMHMLLLINSATADRTVGSSFDNSHIYLFASDRELKFLQLAVAISYMVVLMELLLVHEVMK